MRRRRAGRAGRARFRPPARAGPAPRTAGRQAGAARPRLAGHGGGGAQHHRTDQQPAQAARSARDRHRAGARLPVRGHARCAGTRRAGRWRRVGATAPQPAGAAHPLHRPRSGARGPGAAAGAVAPAHADRHRRVRQDPAGAAVRAAAARGVPRRRLVRRPRAAARRRARGRGLRDGARARQRARCDDRGRAGGAPRRAASAARAGQLRARAHGRGSARGRRAEAPGPIADPGHEPRAAGRRGRATLPGALALPAGHLRPGRHPRGRSRARVRRSGAPDAAGVRSGRRQCQRRRRDLPAARRHCACDRARRGPRGGAPAVRHRGAARGPVSPVDGWKLRARTPADAARRDAVEPRPARARRAAHAASTRRVCRRLHARGRHGGDAGRRRVRGAGRG